MKEKKLLTIMIGMRRTGENMQPDEDDDSQEEIDEAVEFWDNETPEHSDEESDPDHGIPEDDFFHSSNELSVEEFTAEQNAEDEWQQDMQEAQSGGGYNADEENSESEDMPGDNADERSESYDNWDYNAADG